MAPERFERPGDERADIYGLGVTLYELVCGRPAFAEADRAVLVHQVLHQDPPRPRQLDPRDRRATWRRSSSRRWSATRRSGTRRPRRLAEDLRRFLEDRPIRARRVGPWERAVAVVPANKVVAAGLLAALVLVFLAGFAAVTVQWRRRRRGDRANLPRRGRGVRPSRLRIRAQVEIAARDFDQGLELARQGDVDHGLLWMAEALRQAPPSGPKSPGWSRTNLAAWEGQVLRRRAVLEHPTVVYHARFRPDGRAILTAATRRLPGCGTWRPAGRLCPPLDHPENLVCFAFSPDGRLIATGCNDRKVRIWDAVTGRPVGKALDHGEDNGYGLARVEFSPDGRLLLTRDFNQTTRLWEVQTGRRIELPREADTNRFAAISVAERESLINSFENTNRVALFSPDGGRLLLLDRANRRVRTCDIASGTLVGPPVAGEGLAWVSFSPDGRLIGTGDRGRTAQLWDVATGRVVASFTPADGGFLGATFSPDSQRLLVLSENSAQALGRRRWPPALGSAAP